MSALTTWARQRSLLLVAFGLMSGCIIGDDKWQRPRDLPSVNEVDRTRILAIKVDPPMANPGDIVTASALLPDPDGTAELRLWTWCPPELSSSVGCLAAGEEGFLGAEPGVPPIGMVPEAALEGHSEEDQRNGIYWVVQLMAAPEALLDEADEDSFNDPEFFNSVESGTKRLTVSNAEVKNTNPNIDGFLFDGIEVAADTVIEVDAEQSYDVELIIDPDSIEDYEFQLRDGTLEPRTEQLYGTWYATAGALFNPYTLDPYWETQWTAPEEGGAEGSIWVVVRDRRGGVEWIERKYRVR